MFIFTGFHPMTGSLRLILRQLDRTI